VALSKKNRLVKDLEIQNIIRFGKKYESLDFRIRGVIKTKGLSKFLAIVPKKIQKKATNRNVIRRKILAFVQKKENFVTYLIQTNFNLIVIVKNKKLLEMSYLELKTALERDLQNFYKKTLHKNEKTVSNKLT
jgi:ribonuclease P protein component